MISKYGAVMGVPGAAKCAPVGVQEMQVQGLLAGLLLKSELFMDQH